MAILWAVILVVSGIWLVGLAVVVVVRPQAAERFLNRFASSVTAHWVEQLLRLLAGAALWFYSPHMWMAETFRIFGGIILVSAVVLLVLPWRMHQRFARWVLPWVLRHLTLYALGALVIGCWVLAGVLVPLL